LSNCPLKGQRLYQQGNDILSFCGDLVGVGSIPWDNITSTIKGKKYKTFKHFRGTFSIAHFNKEEECITIISDARSQQPMYYSIIDHGFVFSSEMSTFCRLRRAPIFNREWLYDYFFFNFPVCQTTFIKGTFRMPPASVLQYCLHNCELTLFEYTEMFRRKRNLIHRPQSFKLAATVFRNKIPQYFDGSDHVACALTGGWDGRTMLSFAPMMNKVVCYTYGVPGCIDLRRAGMTAKKANLQHRKIYFDNKFIRNLPKYMISTVFLSSGLEKILRSTVPYVYETLTRGGKECPLTISGIALDSMFRGHCFSPSMVSFDIAKIFREGTTRCRKEFWSNVFKNDYSHFANNIEQKLRYLENTFGAFTASEHHLLYILYVLHPELFGGELKIAELFTTVRVPSWDPDIIDLAFSIEESTLSYSEFTDHVRGDKSEMELQAYVLNKASPQLAKVPIRGARPDIVLKHRYFCQMYKIYNAIVNRLKYFNRKMAPLEDWNYWLNHVHRNFVDDLVFSNASLIREYISSDFLESMRESRDIHWIGKLTTAEIILRLIRNRWQNSV
jgi:hypothetical protein